MADGVASLVLMMGALTTQANAANDALAKSGNIITGIPRTGTDTAPRSTADETPAQAAAREALEKLDERIAELEAVIAEASGKVGAEVLTELRTLQAERVKAVGRVGGGGIESIPEPIKRMFGALYSKVNAIAAATPGVGAPDGGSLSYGDDESVATSKQVEEISDGLRKLLDAGETEGEPFSARFDPDTGEFLGGAVSDKYGFNILDAFTKLLAKFEEIGRPIPIEETLKAERYFQTWFGTRFGNLEDLAKELLAIRKREAASGAGTTPTRYEPTRPSAYPKSSGTAAHPGGGEKCCGPSASLAILQASGALR